MDGTMNLELVYSNRPLPLLAAGGTAGWTSRGFVGQHAANGWRANRPGNAGPATGTKLAPTEAIGA